MNHLSQIFPILLLFFAPSLWGQSVVWEATFDTNPLGTAWTTEGAANWEWRADGKASGGNYWSDRSAIGSFSEGGAMVFNADSLQSAGFEGPFNASLTSPLINNFSIFTGTLHLQVNQYARRFDQLTSIELLDIEMQSLVRFQVNRNVGVNQETSAKDIQVFDITEYVRGAMAGLFYIRFHFEGSAYFWIIDDVRLVQQMPIQICKTLWGKEPGEGDFDGGLNGWTTYNIPSPSNPCEAPWTWTADGTATGGLDETGLGQIPIESPSVGNGAVVFNSDFYHTGGFAPGEGPCPGFQTSILESPTIDLSRATGSLIVQFNQFFTPFIATPEIGFSMDNGENWTWLPINRLDGTQLGSESNSQKRIGLPGAVGTATFKVAFRVEMLLYFWTIDDVLILESNYPVKPTIPAYVGERLFEFGKPFQVGCDAAAYVKNQLVVQFADDATETEKAALRDTFGVVDFRDCPCGNIEEWDLGPFLPEDPAAGLSADGPSIGIDERAAKASAKSKVNGADPNKYNWGEIQTPLPEPPEDLFAMLSANQVDQLPELTDDAIIIEILDTGLSFEHTGLEGFAARNGSDTPPCLTDDLLGWNFIDSTNNPRDDHGHGTHLAGISKTAVEQVGVSCSDKVKIRSQKTHDSDGFADLFAVTCALVNALEKDAKVINASWGWQGDSSLVLSNLMDTAYQRFDALFVAAAGNDMTDLAERQQFPACYQKPNLITVGSIEPTGPILSGFSNYNPAFVDIAAVGTEVTSLVPFYLFQDSTGVKSGTSMAAPAVSGVAAALFCQNPLASAESVVAQLLACARNEPALAGHIQDGRVLELSDCLVDIREPETAHRQLVLWPNPASDVVQWQLEGAVAQQVQLEIFNMQGQRLWATEQFVPAGAWAGQIDLSHFQAGVYVIGAKGDDWYLHQRVVKQ